MRYTQYRDIGIRYVIHRCACVMPTPADYATTTTADGKTPCENASSDGGNARK